MSVVASQNHELHVDDIAKQAVDWLVRLSSDDVSDDDRAGFEKWKKADPRHAQSVEKLEGLISQTQGLRGNVTGPTPAFAALETVFGSMRKVGRKRKGVALTMVLVLATSLWMSVGHDLSYVLADLSAATGQWKTYTLPDASQITLNSGSAVNIHFDVDRRAVELVSGEIFVKVAPDAERPFLVETEHSSIRALGTRFVVSQNRDSTILSMLESSVSVHASGQSALIHDDAIVTAGQRVRITREGVGSLEKINVDSVSDAWNMHQLVVKNRPLPEVLDELARHRAGRIQYDHTRLAEIYVSAVLPLDDPDRALTVLANSFSLRISSFTPWLVMVDAPAKP